MSIINIGDLKEINVDWQSIGRVVETFSITITSKKGVRLQEFIDRKTAIKLRNQLNKLINKK